MKDGLTNTLFDYNEPIGSKKYKIYAMFDENNTIIYVGLTIMLLKTRLCQHAMNCDLTKFRKAFYDDYISRGKKIKVMVLFDFNNKIFASFAERILIKFCYSFVNPNLWNRIMPIEEEYFTNYKHLDTNTNIY